MRRLGSVLLVTALGVGALAGCGTDDEASTADGTTTTSTSTTVETTTSAPEPDTTELPGEEVDFFFQDGDELAVVAIAAGDTLAVHAGPGDDFEVVAELAPLASEVTATGRHRSVDDAGIWSEVRAGDATGWVDSRSLAYLGGTDDVTTEIAATPADRPQAATMDELGEAVAATRLEAGDAEGPAPEVVVVDGPSVGDLGEITIDIVGFADDSVLGERLRIFADPADGESSFTVRSVERTVLCRRGATADGLCV